MNKMIKQLSMAFLVLTSVASSLAISASELPTIVSLYNSETTEEGAGSTIAVLRQEPRRAELFICSKRYKGQLRDFIAVEKFFNEGLDKNTERTNCIPYQLISGKNFLVTKNDISYRDAVKRYVFTGAGASAGFANILSDVATWTVDVNDGLGISPSDDILLVGARVFHSGLDNPIISTYRSSFKFSGLAKIQYSEIGK